MIGDHRQRAAGDQQPAQGVAVVGGIGNARPGCRQGLDQGRRERRIAALAGAEREGERPATAVDDGVDLGRAATA